METRSCHWKCHRKNLATSKGSQHGGGGDWEDGVDADKLVWGLVRGSKESARAHTDTRSHTRAHARAQGGAGAHAERARDPRLLPTPVVTALAGWGGDREAVTRATSAAVAFPARQGS